MILRSTRKEGTAYEEAQAFLFGLRSYHDTTLKYLTIGGAFPPEANCTEM